MTKEEIIEKIKEERRDMYSKDECEMYTKGYLDALCAMYEIDWDERLDIEDELKEEEEEEVEK